MFIFQKLRFVILSVFILSIYSCKKDNPTPDPVPPTEKVEGLYILSEGSWGSSNASLSYYDFQTSILTHNVFKTANPSVVLGLGDVANDLSIYGSKMYIVVNNSNKVEITNAKDVKLLKTVAISQPRYVAFYQANAFVTSTDGYVHVIDTSSLSIVKKIKVGNNPEQLVVAGNKLYVANSGGYNAPNYDNTISVIDLSTQQETKKITVDINLKDLVADAQGDLYVSSLGDYGAKPNRLFVVDPRTETVKKKFDFGVSGIKIQGDFAYAYSFDFNTFTAQYIKINTVTDMVVTTNLLAGTGAAAISVPYGIAVDGINGDLYISDAKDFVSPGEVFCFDNKGELKWKKTVGVLPNGFAFLKTK